MLAGLVALGMEQEIIIFLVALTASLAIFGLGILIGRRVETSSDMIPNEQHFQNIIEVAPVGIRIMWEKRFAFFNAIYFLMLGNESSNEVVGRFVEELYAEEKRGRQSEQEPWLSLPGIVFSLC